MDTGEAAPAEDYATIAEKVPALNDIFPDPGLGQRHHARHGHRVRARRPAPAQAAEQVRSRRHGTLQRLITDARSPDASSRSKHRFSAWDGIQALPIDPDQILEALADDLMEYGDLRWAMRNLMSRGMQIPQGGYMQGLRDMLKQLRDQKAKRLEQFDLSEHFR